MKLGMMTTRGVMRRVRIGLPVECQLASSYAARPREYQPMVDRYQLAMDRSNQQLFATLENREARLRSAERCVDEYDNLLDRDYARLTAVNERLARRLSPSNRIYYENRLAAVNSQIARHEDDLEAAKARVRACRLKVAEAQEAGRALGQVQQLA